MRDSLATRFVRVDCRVSPVNQRFGDEVFLHTKALLVCVVVSLCGTAAHDRLFRQEQRVCRSVY